MFEIITTNRIPEVKQIQEAFARKRELEKQIADLIRQYEDETGLAIDMIKYQRDITLPIRGSLYTNLSIVIQSDKFEQEETNHNMPKSYGKD